MKENFKPYFWCTHFDFIENEHIVTNKTIIARMHPTLSPPKVLTYEEEFPALGRKPEKNMKDTIILLSEEKVDDSPIILRNFDYKQFTFPVFSNDPSSADQRFYTLVYEKMKLYESIYKGKFNCLCMQLDAELDGILYREFRDREILSISNEHGISLDREEKKILEILIPYYRRKSNNRV